MKGPMNKCGWSDDVDDDDCEYEGGGRWASTLSLPLLSLLVDDDGGIWPEDAKSG